jgi:protein-disulfide isomerase
VATPLPTNSLARARADAAAIRAEHGDAGFWRFIAQRPAERRRPSDDSVAGWPRQARIARALRPFAPQAVAVDQDLALAGRFDVRATPTFFLNGTRIEGFVSLTELRRQAQQENRRARATLASGIGVFCAVCGSRAKEEPARPRSGCRRAQLPGAGGLAFRGGAAALVTIVEFSGLSVPLLQAAQPVLDRVLSLWRRRAWSGHMPLPSHGRARPAATRDRGVHARRLEQLLQRVHDLLFEGSAGLGDQGLPRSPASRARRQFALEAVRRADHDARIDADLRLAKKLGVSGTPTFYVNGRKLEGAVPFERFSALVQEEIDAARRLVSSGTPRSRVYEAVCGQR